jgi:hypothetical protein
MSSNSTDVGSGLSKLSVVTLSSTRLDRIARERTKLKGRLRQRLIKKEPLLYTIAAITGSRDRRIPE